MKTASHNFKSYRKLNHNNKRKVFLIPERVLGFYFDSHVHLVIND